MPILLGHLKDSEIEKSAKIIIITVIGDTFLITKNEFHEFFEDTLSILESAAKLSVDLPSEIDEQEDILEHLKSLQSSLIESYTCFVQNINETTDSDNQVLGQFIYHIFQFLMDCLNPVFDSSPVSCSSFMHCRPKSRRLAD